MAKCWICGTYVSGYSYTCPDCHALSMELKNLQKDITSCGKDISKHLDCIVQIQEKAFKKLTHTVSACLSTIASTMEWGICEIDWQLQQQTEILLSIDHTLKTPSETKANEWRLHAEELRRRGLLEEAEEFFLKALNEYRLDYRIYVGLAQTYLQMNQFDKAKAYLEKSLPHAPKGEIDYKSYSYRLIGHIYACEEKYGQAALALKSAIELSPNYEDGHYDYAQYCAQIGNTKPCLLSLKKAILTKPLYWYLAQHERNFEPVRNDVKELLSSISTPAYRNAKRAIDNAEVALNRARKAVSDARCALRKSGDKDRLISEIMFEIANDKLKLAKDKLASGNYLAFLEAESIANESRAFSNKAVIWADGEKRSYEKRHEEKIKNALKRIPGSLMMWPLFFGIIGAVGGCAVDLLVSKGLSRPGFLVGIIVGLIYGAYNILKELL